MRLPNATPTVTGARAWNALLKRQQALTLLPRNARADALGVTLDELFGWCGDCGHPMLLHDRDGCVQRLYTSVTIVPCPCRGPVPLRSYTPG